MKKIKIITKIALIAILSFSSCQDFDTDLEVINTENPNDDTINFDPAAVEATAGTLYQNWYMANSNYTSIGMSMNTMADISSCSWGNAGMRDTSSEPRVAWNNTTGYSNANFLATPFNAMYSVLNDANTVMSQYNNGAEFSNREMIAAVAKFAQALSIGYLALNFDQIWLSDEDGAKNDGNSAGHKEAMAFALTKIDEAIAICNSNTFEVPSSWFTQPLSNVDLGRILNSYGARMLTMNSRNSADDSSNDWSKVLTYANNAVNTDFEINHDDVVWYDLFKTYLVYPGWARIDLYVINKMSSSTPDYWPAAEVILPEGASDDARLVSDFEYLDSQNFRPERGSYHYSNYRYSRYDQYITQWTIPTTEVAKAEIDMYKAEANLNLGNLGAAADIINAGTRTTRGNLLPVQVNANTISDAIHYERIVEMPLLSAGLSFYEMRKKDLLQQGTLLHFPVPGAALLSIPADIYTFGGTQGESGLDYSTGGWR